MFPIRAWACVVSLTDSDSLKPGLANCDWSYVQGHFNRRPGFLLSSLKFSCLERSPWKRWTGSWVMRSSPLESRVPTSRCVKGITVWVDSVLSLTGCESCVHQIRVLSLITFSLLINPVWERIRSIHYEMLLLWGRCYKVGWEVQGLPMPSLFS